jgi:hypothetical protein
MSQDSNPKDLKGASQRRAEDPQGNLDMNQLR